MRNYIAILSVLLILGSCRESVKEFKTASGKTMGTTYTIKYEGDKDYKDDFESLLDTINNSMSTYIETSLISRINNSPAGSIHEIDPHFEKVFRESVLISAATNGAFDPSIMPVLEFWGFGGSKRDITEVDSAEIDSLLQLVGLNNFQLQKSTHMYKINKLADSRLDFSAVAKGYAVDVLAEFLLKNDIENFIVEIGGEVRSHGHNDRNELWVIGINKPVENVSKREIQNIFRLNNLSLATSGNYRNFKIINGEKVGHTFNPKTGYPERSNLLSASVFATTCLEADAFATACMVMGLEKSLNLINANDSLEASFVYIDNNSNLVTILTKGAEEIQIGN